MNRNITGYLEFTLLTHISTIYTRLRLYFEQFFTFQTIFYNNKEKDIFYHIMLF